MADPEIVATEAVYSGWAKFSILSVRLPDGQLIRRELEEHGNAASILPYDERRRTAVLVRQFRAPAMVASGQADILEAIAGLVDEPDPAVTAIREAEEEAGLVLDGVEHVGTVFSMPGISTERMHLYLARYHDASRAGAGGGNAHEHENIIVVELSLRELAAMVDDFRLTDLKTLALVQTLRVRRPDLFA